MIEVEKVNVSIKRAVLLGMFALLAIAVWAGPASAAENGLMYYPYNGSIYSVDPTPNAQPQLVTSGGVDDFDVSRDGQNIVYNSPCGLDGCVAGATALYTFPLADGDPYFGATQLEITNRSSSATDINSPKFSPDGQTIYFAGKHVLDSDSDTYGLYSVPTNGGEATKIPIDKADASFSAFALSHDGAKFAIGGVGGVFTVPVSGGVPTRITNDSCKSASYPNFSPDDQTIIYNLPVYDNDTCMGNAVANTLFTTPVSNNGTQPGKAVFSEDLLPPYPTYAAHRSKWYGTYSPDGKSITFDNWRDGTYYLVTAPATGGSVTNITRCTFCDPVWAEKSPAPPDTTAPDTTITSQPSNPTKSKTASFSFTSTETGSTFECSKDNSTWAACTSPYNYSSTALQDGSYNFYVRAKDAAGNVDGTPASYTWAVDTTAPQVRTLTATSVTSSGVPLRKTDFKATFTEKMKSTTLNTSTIKLYKCSSTTSTTCTTQITSAPVTPSADGLSAMLNPYGTTSTLLAQNTRYKVVVTTGATDLAGNALAPEKSSYFTTGSS